MFEVEGEDEPMMDRSKLESQLLRPLVSRWSQRIDEARKARQPWARRAAECTAFYRCAADPIWNGDPAKGLEPLWKGAPPKVKFVLGKAFELVSIFGPSLYYTIPQRKVTPRTAPQGVSELIQGMIAPIKQQQFEMQQQAAMSGFPMPPMPPLPVEEALQRDAQRFQAQGVTAQLMEAWLNYTPLEQPGTLARHLQLAINDMLITGMGVTFTRPIQKPNGRVVTGSFREDPMRLIIDPDHKTYVEAKWIAVQRIEAIADVERKFQLPPGTLKNKATLESSWGPTDTDDGLAGSASDRVDADMFMYYEVYSKRGLGLTGRRKNEEVDGELAKRLEGVAGKYVYLAIAPNCNHPLNLYTETLLGGEENAAATDETIAAWLKWPTESWRDDRFPCEVLAPYPDTDSPYPMAILTPAMGQLKFLTRFMSDVTNRSRKASQDIYGVKAAYYDDTVKVLKSDDDLKILKVSGSMESVRNAIEVFQTPPLNPDVWRIAEAHIEQFEKCTGMNDGAYGGNAGGTQSRTAADAASKREAIMIRPQFLQQQVEEWASRQAGLEAIVARQHITGENVQPLIGETGAMLWDQFVVSQDADAIAAEMEYRVDAGSMRRPNKDAMIANLQQIMPTLLPILQGVAVNTGNVQPLNELLKLFGDAIDQDVTKMLIPPPPPPQPMQGPPEEAPPQEQAA